MIWPGIPLAAPYIEWARYPCPYIQVGITLQHLAFFARYVETTGDRAFLDAKIIEIAAAALVFKGRRPHPAPEPQNAGDRPAPTWRARDFLILHYQATEGRTEPFWQAVRAERQPDSLRFKLESFRRTGRIVLSPEELFAVESGRAQSHEAALKALA